VLRPSFDSASEASRTWSRLLLRSLLLRAGSSMVNLTIASLQHQQHSCLILLLTFTCQFAVIPLRCASILRQMRQTRVGHVTFNKILLIGFSQLNLRRTCCPIRFRICIESRVMLDRLNCVIHTVWNHFEDSEISSPSRCMSALFMK
jgi:hypothetical protein